VRDDSWKVAVFGAIVFFALVASTLRMRYAADVSWWIAPLPGLGALVILERWPSIGDLRESRSFIYFSDGRRVC
jgi:hypothetical protein